MDKLWWRSQGHRFAVEKSGENEYQAGPILFVIVRDSAGRPEYLFAGGRASRRQ